VVQYKSTATWALLKASVVAMIEAAATDSVAVTDGAAAVAEVLAA
jgi:hypothetical protein